MGEFFERGLIIMQITKVIAVSIAFILLAGCASQEQITERKNRIADLRASGYTCFVGFEASYKCFTPEEQERLNNLELACVSGGGTVKYHNTKGYYENCFRPTNKVIVNTAAPAPIAQPVCIFGKRCKRD